jgi:hypothetical protein
MDTRELRELAKRATPGPWKVCDANIPESAGIGVRTINDGTGDGGYIICDLCSDTDYDQEANAAYIAALSPDVLEGLCDKIDALERELYGTPDNAVWSKQQWIDNAKYWNESWQRAIEQRDLLIAERDALRAGQRRLRDALREAMDETSMLHKLECICDDGEDEDGGLEPCSYGQLRDAIDAALQQSTQPAPDQKGKL